jgi:transposase-like protein
LPAANVRLRRGDALFIVDRAKALVKAIRRTFSNLIENLARRLEREAPGVAASFSSGSMGGVRANSRGVPVVLASGMSNSFRYFNSSPDVIRLVVMMYVRYPLSLRNVEDLLAERGIDVSHETVRFW